MIEIIPVESPTIEDLKILRTLTEMGLAEIKAAAAHQTAIRQIRIFEGDWQSERQVLAKVYHQNRSEQPVPWRVRERDEFGEEEFLSPDGLKSRLEYWRSLELETQRNVDLESGLIATPEEFEPHDEDWF
ncbi:hypothetical protein [Gimesia panareensis]|nr:hypothetical protein [Gimesia panareensis]